MANKPPEFCPYCGEELESIDPPTSHYCDFCGEYVFYNPIPTARLAILNDDSILLVKVDTPNRDLWGTPGGVVEAGEDPDTAGVRELSEETKLTVDPSDLVLFDARTFVKFEKTHKTCLAYAVDAADVSGTPQAADEVTAVRFWTPTEFDAADDQLLTSWPTAYQDLQWWVRNARTALNRA